MNNRYAIMESETGKVVMLTDDIGKCMSIQARFPKHCWMSLDPHERPRVGQYFDGIAQEFRDTRRPEPVL